jgi:hypothetical protein
LLAQDYFGRENPIFGCMPILVKKILFVERMPYVVENHHVEDEGKTSGRRWMKRSLPHMQTNLAMLGFWI